MRWRGLGVWIELVSSEQNTFPENVVIFFAQILIYDMLTTGNKKLCGVFR